jgi:hypothetical protein
MLQTAFITRDKAFCSQRIGAFFDRIDLIV